MYKNPRARGKCLFLHRSGGCCTGSKQKTYLPVLVCINPHLTQGLVKRESQLTLGPSRLEGVGIYNAACAATTLIHYTPPPFDVGIVH